MGFPAYGEASAFELLSPEDFAALERRLRGVTLMRYELVGAVPDDGFFDSLVRARGLPLDTAALGLLRREYNYSLWPEYVDPRTDFGGCTQFGTGLVVKYYREWSEYPEEKR